MHNPTFLFDLAVSAVNAGNWLEAERLCQQVVSNQHDFYNGLQLLAIVQTRLGKHDEALATHDLALARWPHQPEALSNRGITLYEAGRFEDALASYDAAIKLRPQYPEVLSNRGNALRQLNRLDEALASFDRALALRPNFAAAHSNRGDTLCELKRFDEALESYDRALALLPGYSEALCNRSIPLRELKRLAEALASSERALAINALYPNALANRGIILGDLRRFDEALVSYDRALALRPDYPEALSNRGVALFETRRFDEALASLDRALELRPDYPEALSNRGNVLRDLRRFDESLASYHRALELRPDYPEALSNCGNVLRDVRRFDEASASYHRAIEIQPDFADAHFNEATLWLLRGDFERGWAKYEWRCKSVNWPKARRQFTQPTWTGKESLDGKTILLHSEQGFGDTIQFCRYVPLVAARGARTVLDITAPLKELMETLDAPMDVRSDGDPIPHFDFHCSLLSLPLAFGTRIDTIPCKAPYLRASPDLSKHWEARLGSHRRARIGLAWAGNPAQRNDGDRSTTLSCLLPLLDTNATFVRLQKDITADDAAILKNHADVLDFSDDLKDFSDRAALIANLDLVISVDTSIAHLGAALGKPTWVLLPFVPDWRWLLDRDDAPWYPTIRLFRQPQWDDWASVIARVRRELDRLGRE